MKFGTEILHTGADYDQITGAVSMPIYHSSTYDQKGEHARDYVYSRSGNPTRAALEETMAVIEGGDQGFAFASGIAAISSVLAIFSAGDHILVTKDVYGGTYRVLTEVFSRFGIEFDFIDTCDLTKIDESIKVNTKALYLETPSNPLLKVTDLKKAVSIAQAHNLITLADNTFMTPYFQQPLQLGIDVAIHSATKYLGGHSDVLAGVVVAKGEQLCQRIGKIQKAFGAVLGPQDCWLLLRGLKTLKVRMDQHQKGAMSLASWLKDQPLVEQVFYPGFSTHPGHQIVKQQASGFGGVVSFVCKDWEVTKQLMKNVEIPVVAVSLGGVESILSHPATMSHAAIPKEERLKLGISNNLLRFSVGLEEPEDLIQDMENTLQSCR